MSRFRKSKMRNGSWATLRTGESTGPVRRTTLHVHPSPSPIYSLNGSSLPYSETFPSERNPFTVFRSQDLRPGSRRPTPSAWERTPGGLCSTRGHQSTGRTRADNVDCQETPAVLSSNLSIMRIGKRQSPSTPDYLHF